MSVINSKFTSIKGSLALTSLLISYNSNRNKCYINCAPTMDTLTISNILCYKQLGLDNESDYVFTNALTQNYFTRCPEKSGPSSLYLRIHNKKIRSYTSKPDGAGVDGIICNIPCAVWNTQIIYYHTDNPQFHYAYGNYHKLKYLF